MSNALAGDTAGASELSCCMGAAAGVNTAPTSPSADPGSFSVDGSLPIVLALVSGVLSDSSGWCLGSEGRFWGVPPGFSLRALVILFIRLFASL